jgi:PAS domain S-box-containing protein
MTELLDVLAEAVTIRDRDGTIAYANNAALRSMGLSSQEDLRARSSRSIMGDYIAEDEHGNPLSLDDVPSMRMLEGHRVESLLMRTVHRETGEINWRMLRTTPLFADDGELFAAVTVIEDMTAVKTAETRMRVLAESGRLLASALDYEQTLQNVANVAVPALADWCAVDLVDADLRRETVVVAHPDPEKVRLAQRLRAIESNEIDPQQAIGRVLRTGRSELFADINDEMLRQGARNEEHLELLRRLSFRSAIVVPLLVPTRTLGAITLVTAESRRRLTEEDLELAEQLGRRAAVAVENAQLHTTLTNIAETLQRSLLPDDLPDIPGWDVAALYRPAGAEQRIDVGGDFYEVSAAGEEWLVVIGDVTGKGVAAASLTALLRHGARFASRHNSRPAAVLRELDQALRTRGDDAMCTALCALLKDGEVLLSSAGHPAGLLVAWDGTVTEAPPTGPLLGAFSDAQWPEVALPISSAEMLLFYTDGVTEQVGPADRFGVRRLRALAAAHATDSPSQLLGALADALDEFRAGRARQDDVAAIALRPRPQR